MNLKMLTKLSDALDNFLARVEKKKQESKGPGWEIYHRIADRAAPEMRDAFLLAMAEFQGSIVLAKVEEALARGDTASAEEAINWTKFAGQLAAMEEVIRGVLLRSGRKAAQDLADNLGIELSFNLRNPAAEAWIKEHTGELITQITEESRQAIRVIIQDAFQNGGHPYETARKIKQYIGLTERDARAVENYRRKLEEEGKLSPQKIEERINAYRDRCLRRRAENIARTETIMAANAGQQIAWQDAADKGLIDSAAMVKQWIVTPDDRLCPICAAMDGEKVPIEGVFSGGVMHPPRHPSCRCAMGLVEVQG